MRQVDQYDNEPYIEHIYGIVRLETSDMDAVYKEHIIQLVGVFGFNDLIKYDRLESCGVIDGRRLYVLRDK